MDISLDDIHVPARRLRLTNPDVVAAIAQDFANPTIGQIAPIVVWKRKADGKWVLIAGEHRYLAARSAKLPTVRAEHWQWQRDNPGKSDEEVSAQATYVEAFENMKRHDLTSADMAYMRGVLLEAQARLDEITAKEKREAQQAQAEADAKARADLTAQIKAEEDAKELARLKAARDAVVARLEQERLRAKKEAEKFARHADPAQNASSSQNGPDFRNLHGAQTVSRVAERIGASTSALRKSQEAINTTGGLDAIAELRGTTLSSEAELLALGALRKEFPAVADRVVANAKLKARVSAVAELQSQRARKLEQERVVKEAEAKQTRAGRWSLLKPKVTEAKDFANKAMQKAFALRCEDEFPELKKAYELLLAASTRISLMDVETKPGKIRGDEYKYGGGDT